MATAPQQPIVFDAEEAKRFAALMAGFDIGNTSEAEAMGKGRLLRRMAVEKKLRLVDVLELPEIRRALDDQMQPVRQPVPDVAALQAENEDLRAKLAVVVPQLTKFANAEHDRNQRQTNLWVWISGVLMVVSPVVGVFAAKSGDWYIAAIEFSGSLVLAWIFFDGDFDRRLMNYWEIVKEKLLLWYFWASQIFLAVNVLLYVACCFVSSGLVGPISFIGWLYHCCHWKVS